MITNNICYAYLMISTYFEYIISSNLFYMIFKDDAILINEVYLDFVMGKQLFCQGIYLA